MHDYEDQENCSSCKHVLKVNGWRAFLRGFGAVLAFGLGPKMDVKAQMDRAWAEHEHHRIRRAFETR